MECGGISIATVPAPTLQSKGHPKIDICTEQIEISSGPKIPNILGVSLRTLRR